MATADVLIAQDNTSDATWRAWVSGIKSAIDSMGTLSQTADAGQFNAATSTRAAGAYLIYTFTDALQSTAPCYIKLLFTSGPRLTLSIGTGTDGAGNLTTPNAPFGTVLLTNTATAQRCVFSSISSRLTFGLEADDLHGAGAGGAIWDVERPRNNVYSEIGTGLCALLSNSNGVATRWVSCVPGDVPQVTSVGTSPPPCIIAPNSALDRWTLTVFMCNITGVHFQIQNPLLGIVLYHDNDLALNYAVPPVNVAGDDHTYINPFSGPKAINVSSSGVNSMMLFE